MGAQLVGMFIDRHVREPASYTSGWSLANALNALTSLLVPIFGILLATPDPPLSLSGGFRAAQAVALVLFAFRDVGGGSPGTNMIG